MNLSINRESKIPVYLQIKNEIKRCIFSGELKPYQVLPPERKLADQIGVNRSTVLNAYRELKAEGLIDAHIGQGTQVMPIGEAGFGEDKLMPMRPAKDLIFPISWQHLMSQEAQLSHETGIIDLIKMSGRGQVISFAAGFAAPELSPIKDLQDFKSLYDSYGYAPFMHTPVEGLQPLREQLLLLAMGKGIKAELEEVLVLSGSQQGLDLLARTFIDVGDTVIVEEPTYIGAIQIFKSIGARVIGVPSTEGGLRMDLLESLMIKHKPKFIYTIPTFQNPSGQVMALPQRKQLLDLSYRYQVPIIEDDAYSELRYDGSALPTLKAMDQSGNVLYLNTFSKFLFPGLRIGYMIAPQVVIKQLAIKRQMVDLHANSLGQWLLLQYLKGEKLQGHIEHIRSVYRHRRDVMAKALEKYAPPGVKWSVPEGGFYIWCELPETIDAASIWVKANDAGVVFVPGEVFYTGKQGQNFMRLNFSFPSPEDIEVGIKLLMGVVELALRTHKEPGQVILETNPIF